LFNPATLSDDLRPSAHPTTEISMALFTSIKSRAATAALALAMAAGGFAAPAQAAGITLNFGTPGYGFGGSGIHLHFGDQGYFKYCLDDDGIINRLEHKGYDNIHIIRHNHNDDYDNKVWVVAQDWKGDWYQMRVDRCTHAVDRLHRVHKHNDHNPFDYNHFGFTFNF
jgi:hypothetical protein